MKYSIRELNGHWMLEKDGDSSRALLLRPGDKEHDNLLGFLGLGKWVRGTLVLQEGEFEL